MSSFIAANPVIASGKAQIFEVFDGIFHNLLITGNLTSTANIGLIEDLVVGNIQSNVADIGRLNANIVDIIQLNVDSANIGQLNVDISNINQLIANVSNISQLNVDNANIDRMAANVSNIGQLNVDSANIDHLTANIANINQLYVDFANIEHLTSNTINAINITADGNVSADYFIGDGTRLTGINVNANVNVITDQYLLANVVQSNIYLSANAVNQPNMLASLDSSGKIFQQSLNGYLVVPEGYAANAAVRLNLGGGGLPIGSIVRQVDNGNSYMLLDSPSNIDANWITFDGVIFPVNTVFGRTGDVLATYGDYLDSYVELSDSVGVVPAGNSVSEALTMLQDTKKDKINRQSMWVANGSQSISNATTIPISFETFRTTGASNATIISMAAGGVSSAIFKNTGDDNLFAISTRVTFGNMASNGDSAVVLSMNGNTSSVNRLAESYQTSTVPHPYHTQIHSLSSTVFIPSGEFVEILATVDNNTSCSVDGLISFSQIN